MSPEHLLTLPRLGRLLAKVGKDSIMRLCLAILIVSIMATNTAQAAAFKIATADSLVTRAIAELVKDAYRQLGHETEFVYLPAKRSLMEVNKGKLDAELARITGVETEFPNLVRVEEPVYTISVSAIVASGSKIRIGSWQDIGKRTVGYPRGYRLFDIRTRGLNATKAKSPTAIIKMVEAGRMDVGLLMTSDAAVLVQNYKGVSVLAPPIESVTLYHYVHVKHRRMVRSLENVLIEMNDSGRSKEILYGQNK